jgi:hypothetical protein
VLFKCGNTSSSSVHLALPYSLSLLPRPSQEPLPDGREIVKVFIVSPASGFGFRIQLRRLRVREAIPRSLPPSLPLLPRVIGSKPLAGNFASRS